MIIVPSRNLVAVTLGSSWGSGKYCASGQGYSEAFTAESIWRSMSRALEFSAPLPSGPLNAPADHADPPPCSPPGLPSTSIATSLYALGSCTCYCPPDEGFGQCFPANSEAECSALVSHELAQTCSPVAVLSECSDTTGSDNLPCDSLDIKNGAPWNRCTEQPCIECTQLDSCPHPLEGTATASCQCSGKFRTHRYNYTVCSALT